MSYEIDYNCLKSVQKWNPVSGADGPVRDVDVWGTKRHAIEEITARVVKDGLKGALSRYGVSLEGVQEWKEEPGRFTTCRVENNDGEEDKTGMLLADYDIRVTVRKVEAYKPLDISLGFDKA